jgi:hypothetical protein
MWKLPIVPKSAKMSGRDEMALKNGRNEIKIGE